MNFRSLFLAIFLGFGCVATVKAAASLAANPVVFVDFGPLQLSDDKPRIPSKFHDMADILNRYFDLCIYYNEAEFSLLKAQLQDFVKRLHALAQSIAKRLGACAVVPLPHEQMLYHGAPDITFWVDPAYDITNEVVDTLNKEYDAKHS